MLGSFIGARLDIKEINHSVGVTQRGEYYNEEDPRENIPYIKSLGKQEGIRVDWFDEMEEEYGVDREVMWQRVRDAIGNFDEIPCEIPVIEKQNYRGANVSLWGDRYTGNWDEWVEHEDDDPEYTTFTVFLLPPFEFEEREESFVDWKTKEPYTRTYTWLKWSDVR
jgi:hypothetical protein